jgi:hypothetical protein
MLIQIQNLNKKLTRFSMSIVIILTLPFEDINTLK